MSSFFRELKRRKVYRVAAAYIAASGATIEPGEPFHAATPGCASSVWYTWRARSDQDMFVTTEGSDFDTVLAVYEGESMSALSGVASDDDGERLTTSSVSLHATAGVAYRIAVAGYEGSSGKLVLSWRPAAAAEPPDRHQLARDTPEDLANEPEFLNSPAQVKLQQRLIAEHVNNASPFVPEDNPCPNPAGPNEGRTWLAARENSEENSSVTETFLLLPSEPSHAPTPGRVIIGHKIVTHDTPRDRSLFGKLRLKLVSGDPAIIGLQAGPGGYLSGTDRNVIETGHSGCGIHTWHWGTESYYFKPVRKGKVVLRAEIDRDPDDGGDGPPVLSPAFTINVIRLKQNEPLWWFQGADAKYYYEVVKITAEGLEGRTDLSWGVEQGADKVKTTGQAVQSNWGSPLANAFEVQSIGRSLNANDVAVIKLTVGGITLQHSLIVFAPRQCVLVRSPDDTPAGTGYRTLYVMQAQDGSGKPLPQWLELNEDFEHRQDDFTFGPGTQRWGRNLQKADWINGSVAPNAPNFQDSYKKEGTVGTPPEPVYPWADNADERIDHCTQVYRAGSRVIGKGLEFRRHTLQRYRGFARQLGGG